MSLYWRKGNKRIGGKEQTKGRAGTKEEREGRSSKEKAEELAKKMEELARKHQNTTQNKSKSTGAAGVKSARLKRRRIGVGDQLRQMLCTVMLLYIPRRSKRGYWLGVGAVYM